MKPWNYPFWLVFFKECKPKNFWGVWGRSPQRKIACFGMISMRKVLAKYIRSWKSLCKIMYKIKKVPLFNGGGLLKLFFKNQNLPYLRGGFLLKGGFLLTVWMHWKFQKFRKSTFFHESVVFVAFVAFWVLLMLFFKISKIRKYS